MDISVFLHVRFLMKSLSTKVARVWPGVTVDEKMCGKGAATLECLSALRALKKINQVRWLVQVGNCNCCAN